MELLETLKTMTLGELAPTITGTILAIFLIALRKKLEKIFLSGIDKFIAFIKKLFKSHKLGKHDVYRESRIQELIIEMRARCDSDRSHVFLFHNGEDFSCDHPMFKVSCTHESVASGIASVLNNQQNVRCSAIIDLIKPYWEEESTVTGISRISPDYCEACKTKGACQFPQAVYLFEIGNMIEGSSKSGLAEQGIKYILNSPIVDTKKRVVGFTGVEYCKEMDLEDMLEHVVEVCQKSNDIAYLLNQK